MSRRRPLAYKIRRFEKNSRRVFQSSKVNGFDLNLHYPRLDRTFVSFYTYNAKRYWV